MDIVTIEIIVFCLVTLFTGVISSSIFIGSCKTTVEFTNYDASSILIYDGSFLTDSFGQPCEAVVEIKHASYSNINICVKFYSGNETCRQSVRFYYAEDPLYSYYYCDQIQHQAICKRSNAVFVEFQPWNKTENTESIKIEVYKQEYSENTLVKSSGALYVGIIVGCVVVVIVIAVAAFLQHRSSRNNRRQTVNQPRPQLTRYSSQDGSQDYQSPSNSAEPPKYTDVIAAEKRQNNGEPLDTTNVTEPKDTIKPSAPPLPGEPAQENPLPPSGETIPEDPLPPHDDTIPEDPPPPYPGYS